MPQTEKEPKFRKGQPEPGQAPQLPQGAATELNNMLEEDPQIDLEEEGDPEAGSLTEFDDILFSGSDYPDEPMTEGAPFGPGANSLRSAQAETDDEFMARAAVAVAGSPSATSKVKSFVTRVANGE